MNTEELVKLIAKANVEDVKQKLSELSEKKQKLIINDCFMGYYPLHVAVFLEKDEVVRLLLEAGADPDVAIENCDVSGHYELDRELFPSPYSETWYLNTGTTPLHLSVRIGCFHTTKLLLEFNADVAIMDEKGQDAAYFINNVRPRDKQAFKEILAKAKLDASKRKEARKEELDELKSIEKTFSEASTQYLCSDLPKSEFKAREFKQALEDRLVGQKEAINQVVSALQRKKTGWSNPNKPLVFMFIGSSGVGKTDLSKHIVNALRENDDQVRLARIDMAECQQSHDASKLIGAPPGYLGYQDAGVLTNCLKKYPRSVVLLDEIEKAHTDILTILLALFDEGRLTDGQGKTVHCEEAIFIMTSNVAHEEISKEAKARECGAGMEYKKFMNDALYPHLKTKFKRDEFLGRIDQIICFFPFTTSEVLDLTKRSIDHWVEHAKNQHGIEVSYSKDVAEYLSGGFVEQYGARSLLNYIEAKFLHLMANSYEEGLLKKDCRAFVYLVDDKLVLEVEEKEEFFDAFQEKVVGWTINSKFSEYFGTTLGTVRRKLARKAKRVRV